MCLGWSSLLNLPIHLGWDVLSELLHDLVDGVELRHTHLRARDVEEGVVDGGFLDGLDVPQGVGNGQLAAEVVQEDSHHGRLVEVLRLHEVAEGGGLGLQRSVRVVVADQVVRHLALGDRSDVEAGDDAEVVGAALQREPEVGVGACAGVRDFAACEDNFVAYDVVAAETVLAGCKGDSS